ncbi:unnamed protein product, partial [Effrenium voratum]
EETLALPLCHGTPMPTTLFTFGCGPYGELGHARPENCHPQEAKPVAFPGSAPHRNGEPWVQAVALGTDHSMAIVGGKVYRWGLQGAHAVPRSWRGGRWTDADKTAPEVVPSPLLLADLRSQDRSRSPSRRSPSPRRGVASITCGGSNSFVLTTSGEVLLLGGLWPPGGETGQLRHLWGIAKGGPPSRVAKVAAGWRHCLLLTEAGRVFALGDDEFGQCAGSGSGAAAISLSQCPAIGVAAGACHSFAWDSSGRVFGWGHGGSGRLGLGTTSHHTLPEQVEALVDVCGVSCGANFSTFVTNCGHHLWACGGNNYGQLGCDCKSKLLPTPVDLTGEVVAALESGTNHVICLTRSTAGRVREERTSVWTWGCSTSGQCGRTEQESPRPQKLLHFSPPSPHCAVAVAAGRSHSAVIASGGTGHLLAVPRFGSPKVSCDNSLERDVKAQVTPIEATEDIIEEFLTGLSELSELTELTERSRSPAAALVEMGEAALRGEGDKGPPEVQRVSPSSPAQQRGRLGLRHDRYIGRRSVTRPRERPSRERQPKPKQPKEPKEPKEAKEAKEARGFMSRSYLESTHTEAQVNIAGRLLADALEADKWSGIHESLKGLSSFIAQIGSPERMGPMDRAWYPETSGDEFFQKRDESPFQRGLKPCSPVLQLQLQTPPPEARRSPRWREDSVSDALDFSPRLDEEDNEPYELTEQDAQAMAVGKLSDREKRPEQPEQVQHSRMQEELQRIEREELRKQEDLRQEARQEDVMRQEARRQEARRQEERRQEEARRQEEQRVEEARREEARREEVRREEALKHEGEAQGGSEQGKTESHQSPKKRFQRFQEDDVDVESSTSEDAESPRPSATLASAFRERTPGTDGRMSSEGVSRTRQSMSSADVSADVDAILADYGQNEDEESTETEDGDWV